jgi:hypothetical protein
LKSPDELNDIQDHQSDVWCQLKENITTLRTRVRVTQIGQMLEKAENDETNCENNEQEDIEEIR